MKQISKRLLGGFLAIVMLVSMLPNSVSKAAATAAVAQNAYVTGDIIEYGTYPQTKVTDGNLITALNSQTLESDNTATYEGSRYKRVYFTQYKPYYYDFPATADYSYQDDNGYTVNTIYWFKVEPVKWRVLSNTNNELFVMADKILDSKAYNEDNTSVTWETSTLRSWLNNDFYNTAFSAAEQAMIITSAVVNANNPWFGTTGGNNTNDKLFLLACTDTVNTGYGFSADYATGDTARQAQGTDFSKSNGLYAVEDGLYAGNSFWWLRTPGSNLESACDVYYDGYNEATYSVYYASIGVRPVLRINLPITPSNITFDANGGTGGTIVSMTAGELLTAPAVDKDGYTFAGWSPDVPATVPDTDTTYTAQWISNSVTTGDIIIFGSYPQTKVTDTALIAALDLQTLQSDNTVTYGGSKYKRVFFTQYSGYWGGTTTDAEQTYQDENGYYMNTVYWFKFEPLEWRVLSNKNGELFVMADKILDAKAYHNVDTSITWETCTMRSWLNNDFCNTAFSLTEQAIIKTSTVVNANNPWHGTEGGNNTNDKLFLLSYADMINPAYGFSPDTGYDTAREAQGTDFSKSSGLFAYVDGEFFGKSHWWLRSPGDLPNNAGIIFGDGYVDDYYYIGSTYVGARPAFKIALKPENIVSAEGSGCVIDYLNNQIFGLAAGITSLAGFVDIAAGYELSYTPTANGFGTGTVANVMFNGAIVERYTIIIYGDVNGDGSIDSIDAGVIVDVENYLLAWQAPADAATIEAADVNNDGSADSIDAGIIVDAENYMVVINQSTGIPFSSKITFNTGGGTEIAPLNGNIGEFVAAPAVPEKIGYVFLGWLPALPATFSGGNLEVTAQWGTYTYNTGDIIQYGTYPQTKVTNSLVIAALNAQTLQADNTVTFNGSTYKRVYFTLENGYEITNGYNRNTAYWFKVEPIQWRVMSHAAGEIFVIAVKILDSKVYDLAYTVTWETCTMRSWLNNDFYNTAFNPTEQARIKTSTVLNYNNPFYGTPGGNNTNDKLFLLSYDETIDPSLGFQSSYVTYDPARLAQGTDYSKANGLYIEEEISYGGNSLWWLRSPGSTPDSSGFVSHDGYQYAYAYFRHVGARPVFRINLN